MSKNKACPLKFSANQIIDDGSTYLCEGKECAWWDGMGKKCGILALADIADEIFGGG